MEIQPGALYIVATPIGNLGDITLRAVEVLRGVDVIAAEDTRHTQKLLNHLQIKNRVLSFHEHSDPARARQLAGLLTEGKSVALVTDAGTPLISDPGAPLTELAAAQGAPIYAVPGACACIAALTVSALPAGRFTFEGFLPRDNTRMQAIERVRHSDCAVVLYESPHHLARTLSELAACMGERRVAVCKELTKLHEAVLRTTLAQAAGQFAQEQPRGEYALVIEGAPPHPAEEATDEQILAALAEQRAAGLRNKEAAAAVAKALGVSRNRAYQLSIRGE